jgi:hypothetical protein
MKKLWLLASCLLLICSCSDSSDKKIVGKWQEVNNPKGTLIFDSDHKGQAFWPGDKGEQQGSPMTWKYLKDENKVSVITPPGPVNFEIKGDRLIAPNGLVLTKVQ